MPGPVIIFASITNFCKLIICSLVPLHNFGGFKLRNKITGIPIFKVNWWFGIPDGFNELINSIGKLTAWSSSIHISTE